MPFLELFDETLDINSTENYELSLQVSPDALSFCLLDSIRNKFVMIRSFGAEDNKYFNADKINEFVHNDDFLTRRYKKVSCVMPSQKFTLVPKSLYDPGKKQQYFELNHHLDDDNLIFADKINDPDVFIVYSVPRPIYEIIMRIYPGISPHNHVKVLFENTSLVRRSVNGNYIHAHIERDFFSLFIFNNNLLKFCNSFTYHQNSDILYYVLNVFKSLGIKQEETIFFSGFTQKYDDLSGIFSSYVRNVKFSEPSHNFTFSYVFNDTELHRFINLFNVINCE